ncbi:MAG TPA: CopG family transcriptional regulator [Phycisphaerae bacterium]|nr:CopG family transcriptional regulator [Phycisphaerae bacterium]
MTMSIKLPPPLEAKLIAEARARRISKSQIVRELLEKHFKTAGKRRPKTFGEVAGHLIGVVKNGPSDLSTNPKYMEGFGE